VPVGGSSFRSGNDLNLDLFEGEGRQTFPFFVDVTRGVALRELNKRDDASRPLKMFQLQGRGEQETGAYVVVREDFRRPRICTAPTGRVGNRGFLADGEATQQMDIFSGRLGTRAFH
jgi:hypothetical protein